MDDFGQRFVEFSEKAYEISMRYENQDVLYGLYRTRPHTPKQEKRMRKQRDKWRKRIMGL